MATVFMARLALFLSSVLLLPSCSREKSARFVNVDHARIKHSGGFVYVNDSLFTGTLFTLNERTNDTLESSSFLKGKEHGTWKQLYLNGSLKEVRYFEHGKKQGEYRGWWPNGSKKFLFHFTDDEYNGTCYEWDENGQLSHEANYLNGHEEGAQRAWYANGKIKSNYIILNGRRYGLLGTKNCKNVSDSVFKH
jgi:antitoxin component YwqK of YwqJK toxin-antitoxin module